ncbi:MAG: hypothetical protein ABSC29_00435 [Minisyncoccia bacterium]|jgi:hypothetical protein
MNLFQILKQFKNIEPDPAFKETSRRAILAYRPVAPTTHLWSAQRTLWRIIETGAAVALTGFFVLLITGAFSGSRFVPVQYSAVDPQSLHAEAQAIDIQIQLANVTYAESAVESTVQTAGGKLLGNPKKASSTALSAARGTTEATSTITIDQALQGLSQ